MRHKAPDERQTGTTRVVSFTNKTKTSAVGQVPLEITFSLSARFSFHSHHHHHHGSEVSLCPAASGTRR